MARHGVGSREWRAQDPGIYMVMWLLVPGRAPSPEGRLLAQQPRTSLILKVRGV